MFELVKYNKINDEWVFIFLLFIFMTIALLRVLFRKQMSLMLRGIFNQHYLSQLFKLTINTNISKYLLIVSSLVVSFISSHPSWGYYDWSIYRIFKIFSILLVFFYLKYLFIQWIGHVFQKSYHFEEVIFISFIYEKVSGIIVFPFLILSIYSPFNPIIILNLSIVIYCLLFLIKYLRMIYLGIFKSSFSKTHLFIYLCTLEILPLIVVIKYFLF